MPKSLYISSILQSLFTNPVTNTISLQYHQNAETIVSEITETMADDSAVRETDVQAGASFDT